MDTGNWLQPKRRACSLFWISMKSMCVHNVVYAEAMHVSSLFLFDSQRPCETTL